MVSLTRQFTNSSDSTRTMQQTDREARLRRSSCCFNYPTVQMWQLTIGKPAAFTWEKHHEGRRFTVITCLQSVVNAMTLLFRKHTETHTSCPPVWLLNDAQPALPVPHWQLFCLSALQLCLSPFPLDHPLRPKQPNISPRGEAHGAACLTLNRGEETAARHSTR